MDTKADIKPINLAPLTSFTSDGLLEEENGIENFKGAFVKIECKTENMSDVEDENNATEDEPVETSEQSGYKCTTRKLRQGVYSSRARKYHPEWEEPYEKLTTMSVQGLSYPYVSYNEDGLYQCTKCAEDNIVKRFKHRYSFLRHAFLCHEGLKKVFPCPDCQQEFSRPDKARRHRKLEHQDPVITAVGSHTVSDLMLKLTE